MFIIHVQANIPAGVTLLTSKNSLEKLQINTVNDLLLGILCLSVKEDKTFITLVLTYQQPLMWIQILVWPTFGTLGLEDSRNQHIRPILWYCLHTSSPCSLFLFRLHLSVCGRCVLLAESALCRNAERGQTLVHCPRCLWRMPPVWLHSTGWERKTTSYIKCTIYTHFISKSGD